MFAVQADGADIQTVESLAPGAEMHPLQEAFRRHQGLQCGFCTPGMLLRGLELINDNPNLTAEEAQRGHLQQHVPLHRLPVHRRRGLGRRHRNAR